ncbi:F-box family protein [Actinidia rufa]|uniref:F-box family protein n=1 Tax=Actinidia rufa TaxID=165716 RepID=A0A7J0E0Y5_9ERIC|nr:F-box family protein [Actinidia rufa]
MGLGKKCGSNVIRSNELELRFVRHTRSMSGKRIVLLSNTDIDSTVKTPKTKRHCSERKFQRSEKSLLEALPLDILTRILCGVDHDDLVQLFHVSKMIRAAALVAKQLHFAYRTPIKTSTFQNSFDLGNVAKFEEVEAPNAPKQFRSYRSRLSGKKNLADISVALFASQDE